MKRSNEQQKANVKNNNNNNNNSLFWYLKYGFVLLDVLVLFFSWVQVTRFSENECQMTFMYPEYSKIDLVGFFKDAEEQKKFGMLRKYNLFRYTEKDYSHYSKKERRDDDENVRIKTTFALFIPGNGGDYAQVRSLAHSTHTLGKYINSSSKEKNETKLITKIEWYAMDFNEELSAFDADAMDRQVESTRWVLEEYFGSRIFSDDDDGKKYSRNVIVVGHSMGGLVAKYAAEQVVVNTDKKKKNRRIEHVHVTTLATPHAYHPGAFALSSFVNHAWWKRTSKKKSEREKSSISLMSVSGGIRDWQVSGVDASLVLPSNDSGNDRNRNSERVKVVSTRTSCDHLAICWCKQVILSLSVALQRVAKSGRKEDLGNISQFIEGISEGIPPHLGWRGFEDTSSRKKDDGVFIDGFSEDDNTTNKRTRVWYTLASILVARTPNVASAAIFWHVLLSSSLSSLVSVSLGLAFSSLYVLSSLIENIAVGAKEMRALGLDVYVLFATSVVLVSGYGAAKNLHVLFCKMLASSRKNTASTKFGFLQEMSLLAHLSISAALSAVAPVLVHAYLIVFKCIISTDSNLEEIAHSCCASVWAFFLLLPAFVTKVKDGNLPGGVWSGLDSSVALCTAIGTILVYFSKLERKIMMKVTALFFCALSSGAGMVSLVHLALLFFSF